jgi:glyoxylase-like metal-dependent hydrolase (beta-lactamase superfamily II)
MKSRNCLVLAVLLPAMMSSAALAQSRSRFGTSPTILESYQKATTLLAEAIAAHGGIDALREAEQIRVTQAGYDFHRTQGRRIAKPYDSTVRRVDLMIDLKRGQIVSEITRGYPGGFHYVSRFVSAGDKHYLIAPRNRNYSVEAYPPAREQFINLFVVPQAYLLAAHETRLPGARRYLGRIRLGATTEVEAITFNFPTNGSVVLGLDPATKRLRAVLNTFPDIFTGDTEGYTEFDDWRLESGVLLPSRVTQHRAGERTSELRFTGVTRQHVIPDSLLAPPANFTIAPADPAPQAVQPLAPDVWIVGSGSKSLVVGFSDYLVAIDAPTNGSAEVIRRAKTIGSNKPIRYVVPTHHHDDHFGGVRLHAAAGATIVTTPGNIDYLRRVMASPVSTLIPAGSQAPPSASYNVETLHGNQRVFSDGKRVMEIHRIASPHAEEMLIAWLPAEGILFHADLIEAPQAGVALPGANAETTMHLAEFIREKGWNVRVFAGAHATLANPSAFTELVANPLVPPSN